MRKPSPNRVLRGAFTNNSKAGFLASIQSLSPPPNSFSKIDCSLHQKFFAKPFKPLGECCDAPSGKAHEWGVQIRHHKTLVTAHVIH